MDKIEGILYSQLKSHSWEATSMLNQSSARPLQLVNLPTKPPDINFVNMLWTELSSVSFSSRVIKWQHSSPDVTKNKQKL